MKFNGKKLKKALSFALTAAMVVTSISLPQVTKTVYADSGVTVPSTSTYLSKEDFSAAGFNTTYNLNGGTAQKVYFGKNGSNAQKWYIAGAEDNGLVLFCDPTQPLATGQAFLASKNYDTTNNFNNSKYDYNNDGIRETEVYANHYGASDLRASLKELEKNTAKFSEEEQNLMDSTTINNSDTKNEGHSIYQTTDKLYAAQARSDDMEVIVGKEHGALIVNVNKEGFSNANFWLRSPHDNNLEVNFVTNGSRYYATASDLKDVVPAFHLNLSSVLFSSAATTTTVNETAAALSSAAPMTFRFDSALDADGTAAESDRISAEATFNNSGVTVSNAVGNEYLYVQWNDNGTDKVYSCAAANGTVSAATIGGAAGFELNSDCKVWLEKKVDNVTYAKEAVWDKTPSTSTYLSKEDFSADGFNDTYNLGGVEDSIAQKVYFGKNGSNAQKWYIAGAEGNGLVLFCDPTQPLATGQSFLESGKYYDTNYNNKYYYYNKSKKYDYDGTDTEVYANHYGASDLRASLKTLEKNTSKFSEEEQNLMDSTTINNSDTKNEGHSIYQTTDKLYVAAKSDDEQFTIKVGQYDGGLKIDISKEKIKNIFYDENNYRIFWLRSPNDGKYYSNYLFGEALFGVTGNCVFEWLSANYFNYVIPAFHLNLSSVLFASAATAATVNETAADLGSAAPMTFRFDSAKNADGTATTDRISATATVNNSEVTISNAVGNEYLYVQWNDNGTDKVYSCAAANGTVSATTISDAEGFALTSDCKVWLEKNVDNVTYAKEAVREGSLSLKSDKTKVCEGEEVTVTVAVNEDTYAGVETVLTYNKDLFKCKSIDAEGCTSYEKTAGGIINCAKATGNSNTMLSAGDLFKVTFTANEGVDVNSEGTFTVTGKYVEGQTSASENASELIGDSLKVGILKKFADANKPTAVDETSIVFDGNKHKVLNNASNEDNNATYTYLYKKNGSDEYTASTNPQFSEVGTYKVKCVITKDGYKTETVEGTLTITKPEIKVEVTSDYVAGKALILVFSNLDKNIKYDNNDMFKLRDFDYQAATGDYENVYGIIADNSDGKLTQFNVEAVEEKVTFAAGTAEEIKWNTANKYDVNGTETLDISDAVAAMSVYNTNLDYFSGNNASLSKLIFKADVNGDRIVDIKDTTAILRALVEDNN